ncbi:serine/threonine protein kinase [Dactylosporangium roseum]|uniref:non-specific serine/threonine protein kinase n=1 Tax=Dactylosporangium roseum TaxID=47989 RepID=A0ABY5ZF70_9ACTN|nr:serine/threonine-protein kinase [Dactylosporangium roseum]UWZ40072.1 serine/threonine protein kinase [Dactylosporangium roseum]
MGSTQPFNRTQRARPARAVNSSPGRFGPRRSSVAAARRLLDGRYRMEGLLGSGGMGTVWRGHDLRLNRPVAIKVLSGGGLGRSTAMERFEREARAVGRLSHPNVVRVYDFGVQDGDPYLVMELMDGPTVAQLLSGGPLPVDDTLALAAQICDGLGAAHAAGIIHRDVKPGNLILAGSGAVKICDFGVARLLDTAGQADLTGTAVAVGSPEYMAPEQITSGPVDARSDLYALGCTMYAMLAGSPPFATGTSYGIVHQHLTEAPQPLHVRRPDVPPAVADLVADLLAKRPDERPQDTAAVRARIAAAADPAAPAVQVPRPRSAASSRAAAPADDVRAARPAGDPPTVERPRRRRLWLAAAAGAAGLAAAALVTLLPPAVQHGPQSAAPPGAAGDASPADAPSPGASHVTVAPASGSAATQAQSQSPGATPPPSSASTPPAARPDRIVALRRAVRQLTDAGDLDANTAADLNHMIDDLAASIATGDPADEARELEALRGTVTDLYRNGRLAPDGYAILNTYVAQVAGDPDAERAA